MEMAKNIRCENNFKFITKVKTEMSANYIPNMMRSIENDKFNLKRYGDRTKLDIIIKLYE